MYDLLCDLDLLWDLDLDLCVVEWDLDLLCDWDSCDSLSERLLVLLFDRLRVWSGLFDLWDVDIDRLRDLVVVMVSD